MAHRTAGLEGPGSSRVPRPSSSGRRGLVLGAGGSLGAAWTIGALCALEEAYGWDVRGADIILGTSAGAIVGSLLALGARPQNLRDHQQGDAPATGPMRSVHVDYDTWVGGALPRVPRPGIGSLKLLGSVARNPHRMPVTTLLAAAAPPGRGSLNGVHDLYRQLRMTDRWPEKSALRVVAVDLDRGTRVQFGGPDGATTDLASAVMASCAVPAWFAPVEIGGRRFVDGCAWSDTNLDLLAGEGLDEVVVLAPTTAHESDHPRGIPARVERRLRSVSTRRLQREADLVRDSGTRVTLIAPGPEDLAAMGANLMDPQRRRAVLETALRTTAATLPPLPSPNRTAATTTPDGDGGQGSGVLPESA